MPPQRWLATVLFLDMVGSTERAVELGDLRWRDLLQKFHDRVRRELAACDGREVTSAGDGFLATFTDPERAILCAWAIRNSLREVEIEVRCGLHVGEVEAFGETVGGIGVHIGARVAGLARPGEVLVSQTVRDAVEGSDVTFEDRGIHRLRGVRGEWRLYAVREVPQEAIQRARGRQRMRFARVGSRAFAILVAIGISTVTAGLVIWLASGRDGTSTTSGGGPSSPVSGARKPPAPPSPSSVGADPAIAILPFDVRDPKLAGWREVLVHLLSTGLDNVFELRAIHEGTVMARWREAVQGEQSPDLDTKLSVARRAGARYAVVGSLLPVGTDVRLVAQVYELADGSELGRTPPVVGRPDSMIQLADRLAIEILRAIGRRDIPQVRLTSIATPSLLAFREYLNGEILFRRSDFEGAIEAYQRAVDEDSTFALALSRLAMAYGWVEHISIKALRMTVERLAPHLEDRLSERDRLLVVAGLAYARGELAALDSLRQMVRRYPDDPEAWNLLGDIYYHLAGQALAPDSVDAAFSQAVQLDSSFTPAYIHLIEHTFHLADSARVAELVQAYGRLAPGTRFDRRNRLAYGLTFGNPAARAAALREVDTVSSDVLKDLAAILRNARFVDVQAEVLRKIARRADNPDGELGAIYAFSNEARRGHATASLRLLASSSMPAWFPSEGVYLLSALDMVAPVDSPEVAGGLRARVSPAGAALRPIGVAAFYSGAGAADQGDSAQAWGALLELRKEAAGSMAAGDSLAGRFLTGAADGLEGYARWKRTHDPAAVSLLDAARRTATGLAREQVEVNATIRWWLGGIAAESGRLQDAERYWSSLERDPFSAWQHPLVTYRLAQVFERLGESERAQAAYDMVLEAWHDADPLLQPLVEEARTASSRLTLAEPR